MLPIKRREFLHLTGGLLGASALRCGGSGDPAPVPETCTASWWLCGNFAPVAESEATSLSVVGALPPELEGLYLRNGPNPLSGSSDHWFLGDGMVHGVRLAGGKALSYRARYVETEVLGVPPSDAIGLPSPTAHQANTSLVYHAGKLLCLDEIGLPYEISASDLATVGPYDFGGQLESAMTAHPKIDPATGEMLFFNYGLLAAETVYHATDPRGLLVRSEAVPLPMPVMMHDFQVTPTHVVWLDLPVVFSLDLAIAGAGLPFAWMAENGARIGVMPRTGTAADVEWFEIEPCYVFHTFNAFHDPDDPERIVLDVVRYPDLWVTGSTDFDNPGEVWRYSMKLGSGRPPATEIISDRSLEFPRIDPRRQGLAQRWGWANRYEQDGALGYARALAKLDFQSGKLSEVPAPEGLHLDELVFVPASASAGEDEGWLLGYGFDPTTGLSRLLVLDAQAHTLVAQVPLPTRVPHGFHGTWVPA